MAVPSNKKLRQSADGAVDRRARRRPGRWLLAGALVGAAVLVGVAVAGYVRLTGGPRAPPMDRAAATYVGGAACAGDYECRGGCLPANHVCGMRCDAY